MSKSVLVIAAHMDDETLGVGGTLLKFKDMGYNTYVCSVTDRAYNHEYIEELIKEQRDNLENACKILNVNDIFYLGLKDERLDNMILDSLDPIEKVIQKIKPEILFTNFLGDSNQDHQSVFKSSLIAARSFSSTFIKKYFCYETLSSTEQSPFGIYPNFKPNYYINIEKYLSKKIEAFSCFEKESRKFPHPRSLEGIEILAKYRGMEIGCNAAEGFILLRGFE